MSSEKDRDVEDDNEGRTVRSSIFLRLVEDNLTDIVFSRSLIFPTVRPRFDLSCPLGHRLDRPVRVMKRTKRGAGVGRGSLEMSLVKVAGVTARSACNSRRSSRNSPLSIDAKSLQIRIFAGHPTGDNVRRGFFKFFLQLDGSHLQQAVSLVRGRCGAANLHSSQSISITQTVHHTRLFISWYNHSMQILAFPLCWMYAALSARARGTAVQW